MFGDTSKQISIEQFPRLFFYKMFIWGTMDYKKHTMNKRFFLQTVIMLLMAVQVQAQEPSKGSNMWNVNLSYDFALKSGNRGIIGFQPEYGHYFTDQCYVGLGTGILTNDKIKSWAIPLFLRAEFDFPSKGSIPYFSVQGGYDFSVSNDGDGSFRINPSIGVKMPISNTTMLNLGFGYTRTISDGYGADYLGLKAGIIFGTQGRGLSNFFKKFDYGIELEGYSSVTLDQSNASWNEDIKYSSIYGFRFSMLYPIFNRFFFGPSIGAGLLKDSSCDGDEGNEVYLDLALRAKYKVTQIAINDKIYPFALIDFGYAPGYADFVVRVYPAVGLAYQVGKKSSVDISVGYSKIAVDGWDEVESKGALRLAIGYNF